jgi:hypothetical protein
MKHVHFILQGKGGVGKSLLASLLAQHYLARDITPVCIDTDPVNQTFAGYKAFSATQLKLMNGDDLDPRAFDQLVEQISAADDDAVFIIDNGAATFVPLCAWMIENDVVSYFKGIEVELIIHSVLTGGQALGDTMVGLKNILKSFDLPTVVWLNEYFGKPEKNGTTFEQSALFEAHEDRIRALIRIPLRRKETFGADLDQILREKMTFREAADDPSLTIMTRQRLAMIWRDLDAQMTAANL